MVGLIPITLACVKILLKKFLYKEHNLKILHFNSITSLISKHLDYWLIVMEKTGNMQCVQLIVYSVSNWNQKA